MKYDAILKNTVITNHWLFKSRIIAQGNIHEDSKGKFLDGTSVTTSSIQAIIADANGNVYVRTKNTMYKVDSNLIEFKELRNE